MLCHREEAHRGAGRLTQAGPTLTDKKNNDGLFFSTSDNVSFDCPLARARTPSRPSQVACPYNPRRPLKRGWPAALGTPRSLHVDHLILRGSSAKISPGRPGRGAEGHKLSLAGADPGDRDRVNHEFFFSERQGGTGRDDENRDEVSGREQDHARRFHEGVGRCGQA